MTGVIIHIALAVWIIIDVSHPSLATKQTALLGLVFAVLWALMCVGRLNKETGSSPAGSSD
jgi:hypothetical protein